VEGCREEVFAAAAVVVVFISVFGATLVLRNGKIRLMGRQGRTVEVIENDGTKGDLSFEMSSLFVHN